VGSILLLGERVKDARDLDPVSNQAAYINSGDAHLRSGEDAINRSRHGVSLNEAARLDWNRGPAKPATRTDHGEPR
jgi:hypothetical protein